MLWNGARLVSLAAGGALAELVDVCAVYLVSAALLLVAAVVGFSTSLRPSDE